MMFGIGFPISNSFVFNSFKGLINFSVGQSGGRHILIKVTVKSSMAKSLPEENLLPQNVDSIINYLQ